MKTRNLLDSDYFKCNRIRQKIRKIAYDRFDENDLFGGLRFLDRYNFVTRKVYYGEKELSPGDFLNSYLEQRTFEASL
jgi:hypothetical protein